MFDYVCSILILCQGHGLEVSRQTEWDLKCSLVDQNYSPLYQLDIYSRLHAIFSQTIIDFSLGLLALRSAHKIPASMPP